MKYLNINPTLCLFFLVLPFFGITSGTLPLSAQESLAQAPDSAQGSDSQDLLFDADRVEWTALRFEAQKFIFTAKSSVRLDFVPTRNVAEQWIVPPKDVAAGRVVRTRGKRTGRIEIETEAVGSHTTETVWFDLRTADAAQRLKLKHGGYQKTARFAQRGVFVLRASPGESSERNRPPEAWSKLQENYYEHGAASKECTSVSQPSALLYIVSTLDFSPRPKAEKSSRSATEICVFSDKKLLPIAIEHIGTEEIEVDYTEIRGKERIQKKRSVDALRLKLRPIAEESAEQFEMLGMQGAVEIFLDPDSRLPILLRGRLDKLGSVQVELVEAELRIP